MRTSLDLPDEVFRELKMLAAKRGTTLKELLRAAVENEISRSQKAARAHRVKLPILDSQEPGTLDLTNAEIEDLLT